MSRLASLLCVALAVAGCGNASQQSSPEPSPSPSSSVPSVPSVPSPAVAGPPGEQPAPTRAEPAVRALGAVDDPAAMKAIVEAGAQFDSLVGKKGVALIRRQIAADVQAIKRTDPKAGVGVRGNAHRLFDSGWLKAGRMELVGVANRLDRGASGEDCGDVRLIYRLAYTTKVSGESVSSRLPMTAAIVLAPEPRDSQGTCRAIATHWRAPAEIGGAKLGAWMVSTDGPLAGRLVAERVKSVLTNVQVVRWPSSVKPDLGGHAEYTLRSFVRGDSGDYRIGLLENTPDVARLRKDKKLRAELAAWIASNVSAIERGVARVPDKFLANKATSVTPRGFARRINRPYRSVLDPKELAAATFEDGTLIRSPEGLLRRLDQLSCSGCHQARTIAGFHWLGVDGDEAAPGNALAVSMSSLLVSETIRRKKLVDAIATGGREDWLPPFAERPADDSGGYGSHCGLGDPSFASWTCADGLRCDTYDAPADDATVGQCIPDTPHVGDPCEVGEMRPGRTARRDRVAHAINRSCGDMVCNVNRVGFPGGMCTASCSSLPVDGACGVIALLGPFNNCLARKTPFPRCLAEHVSPAGLRACDVSHPCRDDYICARGASGAGACIPPYFLFQLRVDGHPRATSRR